MTHDQQSIDFMAEWLGITTPHPFPMFRCVLGLGLAHLCYTDRSATISLCFISAERKGEGKGTMLLQRILTIADAYGVTLEAAPSQSRYEQFPEHMRDDVGPKGQDLVDWYVKHGFTEKTKDGIGLRRRPGQKRAAG